MKLKEELFVFLVTLSFYFLLFFNPNNKTLVAFFFVYLLVLYWFLKDFKKALLLSYLASWPINVGKTYVFEFVSAWQLNLPFRPYGIATNIVISVKEIFLVLMLFVLIREFFLGRKEVFKFDNLSLLLLFFFFSQVLASLFGSIRPDVSLILSLYSISPLILYWYIRNLKLEKKNILFSSVAVISSMIILEVVISSLQFITRSPLGLSIEESPDFLPIDPSLEAGILAYRPVGTFSHANWLANFLLPILFIFVPSLFFKFKRLDKVAVFSFLFALFTFLLTLARSAWISFAVTLVMFLFIVEKRWGVRLRIKKEFVKLFFLSLPAILPLAIFFLLPRLVNTFYAFEMYGGGYTRLELLKKSWGIINQFPLFGVGLGMEIFYSYQQSLSHLTNIFSYFPEAVHNGYLSLWVQAGIFPLLIFLMISFYIFGDLIRSIPGEKLVLNRVFFLSLTLGILSLYLNSFFHPSLPDLQKIIFLSMIYGNNKKKEL